MAVVRKYFEGEKYEVERKGAPYDYLLLSHIDHVNQAA